MGYRKNQLLGPTSVDNILYNLTKLAEDETKNVAILFNTGLHDVVQLCIMRPSYLPPDFKSCLDEYKKIMQDVKNYLTALPSQVLAVFQSTSAGWLRYGNWGV